MRDRSGKPAARNERGLAADSPAQRDTPKNKKMNAEIFDTENLPEDPELKPVASQWAQKAIEFYHSGDAVNAEYYLKKAIHLDPLAEAYYVQLAEIFRDAGKETEVLKCYDKAIELNPNASETYFLRANYAQSVNRFAEAIANYTSANNLQQNSDYKMYIADCKYGLGDTNGALADLQALLKTGYYREEAAQMRLDEYMDAIAQKPKKKEDEKMSLPEFGIAAELYKVKKSPKGNAKN